MKRLASLLLAGLMVLALAAPAMAEEESNSPKQTYKATASLYSKEPYIKITMPAQAEIVLNPYKVNVVTKAAAETSGQDQTTSAQIIFTPQSIKNCSPVPMCVQVQTTGKASSGITLLKTATATSTTAKQAFLYAEFAANNDAATEPNWATGYSSSNKNQVVIGSTTSVLTTVLDKVEAASEASPNYIWFKIDGSMSSPVSTYWDEKNTIGVTLAFTFVPQVIETTTPGA